VSQILKNNFFLVFLILKFQNTTTTTQLSPIWTSGSESTAKITPSHLSHNLHHSSGSEVTDKSAYSVTYGQKSLNEKTSKLLYLMSETYSSGKMSLGINSQNCICTSGSWVMASFSSYTRTARKVGSDGLIQVYIGCGHPIQTWAWATEWIAHWFKLSGLGVWPPSLNRSVIHSVVRAWVWIRWPHPI
jgi:hypothetical protein